MKSLYDARIRVLCYDLRHARMGNRNAAFKDHGLDEDQMKFLSLVGTKQNLYLSFETFWPEMLYITFVLNEIIRENERREKVHLWDSNIAIVRLLQHQVLNLTQDTVTPRQFATVKNADELKYGDYDDLQIEW